MLYPLTFHPIYKERIWGGRTIETFFGKKLPPDRLIGESWEIVDRPEDVSVIANGPMAGTDLHWLMQHKSQELLGSAATRGNRFPLLVKILDANDRLSLQVHPPPKVAAQLGGEPKTEMWYMVATEPGAELFVGLKRGVTREMFERRVQDGSVADCFHRLQVKAGDAMFLPSGRVHAIGAGNLIFEVQQNSDTTYRVHDWNRLDSGGRPRALHVTESLASIDFEDFEPEIIRAMTGCDTSQPRTLVDDPLFSVSERSFGLGVHEVAGGGRPLVLGLISGRLKVVGGGTGAELKPGEFCLVPACLAEFGLDCLAESRLLWAVAG